MQTSRVGQETAKAVKQFSHVDFIPQRQTRSFAASFKAFAAHDASAGEADLLNVKSENVNDDSSSLSSAGFDIEDVPFKISPSRKRKRWVDTPSSTTVSSISSTRITPHKANLKAESSDDKTPKKVKRKPARRVVDPAGQVEIHPPSNWEEVYDAVKEMRKKVLAPVDTMGCETLAEQHLSPRDKRFQTLIALMLSSQTKDTTNAIAMRRLQTELPHPGLTLENILAIDPVRLNELIYVVGFHNNKTRYIKATAIILRDSFNSDIPDSIEGLMSLPGVGPKMAYLCLSAAWGRTEGIGVDVHVHRITNLWRWHRTKGPEETRGMLEAWLPREKWHEINHLLVGFGQTVCLPVGRKCGECVLSARGLCPSAVVERKVIGKRVRKEHVIEQREDGITIDKNEEVVFKGEEVAIKEEDVTAE